MFFICVDEPRRVQTDVECSNSIKSHQKCKNGVYWDLLSWTRTSLLFPSFQVKQGGSYPMTQNALACNLVLGSHASSEIFWHHEEKPDLTAGRFIGRSSFPRKPHGKPGGFADLTLRCPGHQLGAVAATRICSRSPSQYAISFPGGENLLEERPHG